MMNMVNFLDGLDGLAAGICGIAGGTFAVIALSLGKPRRGDPLGDRRRRVLRLPAPQLLSGADLHGRLGRAAARLRARDARDRGAAEDGRDGRALLPARSCSRSRSSTRRSSSRGGSSTARRSTSPTRRTSITASCGAASRSGARSTTMYVWCGTLALAALATRFVPFREGGAVAPVADRARRRDRPRGASRSRVYVVYLLEIVKLANPLTRRREQLAREREVGVRHASARAVGPGAWAAIALPDRGAVGNAGIVDLGGEALVFDTHFAPGAARELRAAAEELVGPVRWVANSHWHGDHVRGNAVFEGATILATARTRELIATRRRGATAGAQGGAASTSRRDDLRERGLAEELELLEELRGRAAVVRAAAARRGVGGAPRARPRELLDVGRRPHATATPCSGCPRSGSCSPPTSSSSAAAVGRATATRALARDPRPARRARDRDARPGPRAGLGGRRTVATVRDYLEALLELPPSVPERFAALDGAELWERNLAVAPRARYKVAS